MFPMPLLFVLAWMIPLANAESLYPFFTKGVDGAEWCCSKNFAACEKGCAKATPCLVDCYKKHCLRDTNRCQKPEAAAETGAAGKESAAKDGAPAPKMQLRQDGRLTGPGVVTYEAENHAEKKDLTLQGIIFGKDRSGAVKILKSTPTVEVIPSKPSVFTLRVLPKEFDEWSKLYGDLTIAFTFPAEKDHNKWDFLNLLTQDDVAGQAPGQFKVKGAFEPKDVPK